jgi:hypothetical protein
MPVAAVKETGGTGAWGRQCPVTHHWVLVCHVEAVFLPVAAFVYRDALAVKGAFKVSSVVTRSVLTPLGLVGPVSAIVRAIAEEQSVDAVPVVALELIRTARHRTASGGRVFVLSLWTILVAVADKRLRDALERGTVTGKQPSRTVGYRVVAVPLIPAIGTVLVIVTPPGIRDAEVGVAEMLTGMTASY